MVNQLFHFPEATRRHADVEHWLGQQEGTLGEIAHKWFQTLRDCGDDVRELLHDGHPTACVDDAAFAYVDVFKAHVNLGFYRGAELPDPDGLLLGQGKYMRHVKLHPDRDLDETPLRRLVEAAHFDMRCRLNERSEP